MLVLPCLSWFRLGLSTVDTAQKKSSDAVTLTISRAGDQSKTPQITMQQSSSTEQSMTPF